MEKILEEIKAKIEERKAFHEQQYAFCDNHKFNLEKQLHWEIEKELKELRFFVSDKIRELSKLENIS